MKPVFENVLLYKNIAANRFELTVEGHTAFIDYKERKEQIWLIHTESPEELAGKGVAMALIEKTLIYIEENNYVLIPLCPLVLAFIKRHPEWKRIVAPDYLEKLN